MKLNLGCGDFPLQDFINIDIYEGDKVDLVCNILKLPYEDNSVEEIYAGHVIEHLTMEEARKGLKEWLRVLKPNGKIGIVIPEKHLTPQKLLEGDKFPNEPYREHHSFWDNIMLKEEVKKVGFQDIETMNINTYPHLVARVHWQVGVIARKGGKNMKKENSEEQVEIPKYNEKEYSWCKHEKKVVYNPKKKLHCPYCKKLL
ncbi:MAG: methyltransferase domain-containing protein [Candidatus Thorarchaeota archaeon]